MNNIINWIRANKWLCIIFGLGTFLRFYKLDFQSLWLDELYTMNVANPENSYATIIDEVYIRESFPYLYFFIENGFFKIFGFHSIVARIPSALIGSATIIALYKLVQLLYNRNAALIASLLLAVNEFHIYYSQEARAYSFYVFGVILSYYFLIKTLENHNKKNLIGYIICSAFMINTNFFSIINLFSQGLIFLVYTIFSLKENRKKIITYLFIAYSAIFVFFIPNITKFIALLSFDSGWIPPPTKNGITKIYYEFFKDSEFILFLITIIFISYLLKLFKSNDTKSLEQIKKNKVVSSFLILITWISVIIVINVYKSYTSNSVYISRYFSSLLPPIIVILSLGLEFIKNRILKISLVSLFVLFSLLDLFIVNKYYNTVNKTQFRETSNYIIDNNVKNYPVYSSLAWYYPYFLNKDDIKLYDKNLEILVNEMMQDSTKITNFWYTDGHNNRYNLSEASETFLNENYSIENSIELFDCWAKLYVIKTNELEVLDIKKYNSYNQNPDLTKHWIESFSADDNSIKVTGWAFLKDGESYNSNLKLILIGKEKVYKFPVQMTRREDVSRANGGSYNYENSGFSASFNIDTVEPGNYKLGILIQNNKNENVIVTDKTIVK